MQKNICQLALKCKSISDDKMGTDRNIFPFKGIVFTDYTVKGPVDEYMEAIGQLLPSLTDKYPAIGYELRLHKDRYKDEKI